MALLQRLLRRKQQPTPSSKPPLTPARSLSWLLDAAVQRARAGQALLCLLGVLGLALLPLLERRIEFDENALLAGSARPTIRCVGVCVGGVGGVLCCTAHSQPTTHPPALTHPPATHNSYAVPSALDAGRAFADGLRPTFFSFAFSTALQAALSAGGLEVSNHTFSSSGSGGSLSCVNVHAVVRSPRGDGKEALVLVTPINHQHIATGAHVRSTVVLLLLLLLPHLGLWSRHHPCRHPLLSTRSHRLPAGRLWRGAVPGAGLRPGRSPGQRSLPLAGQGTHLAAA
jgi:hypothetical protein